MAETATYCVKSHLEVQLKAELELARVVGGCRAAVEFAVLRPFAETVHDIEEGIGPGFVEAIEEVEALGNDVEPDALR